MDTQTTYLRAPRALRQLADAIETAVHAGLPADHEINSALSSVGFLETDAERLYYLILRGETND